MTDHDAESHVERLLSSPGRAFHYGFECGHQHLQVILQDPRCLALCGGRKRACVR